MGEQLGEGIWREMKLLLVSLDFNVPGFGCPGSPALMLMGGGLLKWVAIYFSKGSSQPRNQTQVPHITGRLFTI